ncbi:MAG: phosphopantothenoylcysteine decarboxylase [Candidatus Omnitrophica bacterium]|nr:phosphopantothenoylcysteine decarboxylase [Candidatus Omnitrophota bacterium]
MKQPMRVLVTAGPTREFIDPVRFISNLSTGNMGYALAKTAAKRGHKTVLVSGPVNIIPKKNIKIIKVNSCGDMFKAVKQHFDNSDCLVMAAAVSDFRPRQVGAHKLKKDKVLADGKINLVQNPDILLWAGRHKKAKVLAGFCMETQNLLKQARRKLKTKNADIIAANKISRHNPAFGSKPTTIYIVDKAGNTEKIGPKSKDKIASILLDKIETLWYKKSISAAW